MENKQDIIMNANNTTEVIKSTNLGELVHVHQRDNSFLMYTSEWKKGHWRVTGVRKTLNEGDFIIYNKGVFQCVKIYERRNPRGVLSTLTNAHFRADFNKVARDVSEWDRTIEND